MARATGLEPVTYGLTEVMGLAVLCVFSCVLCKFCVNSIYFVHKYTIMQAIIKTTQCIYTKGGFTMVRIGIILTPFLIHGVRQRIQQMA